MEKVHQRVGGEKEKEKKGKFEIQEAIRCYTRHDAKSNNMTRFSLRGRERLPHSLPLPLLPTG